MLQRRLAFLKHSIDIVVPVRNRWELTESCLAHVRLQTLPHTVIVCDNGSTDETNDRFHDVFPEVRVVDSARTWASRQPATEAYARHGDIVVLLNNDVDCRPDFLERLVAPFRDDERIGSVAALLLKPGEGTIESFGLAVDPTLAGYPRLRGLPAQNAQATNPVLVGPSGAAAAFRRRAWDAVGGLDEVVFAYGEDVDLALRLRAAGWSAAAAVGCCCDSQRFRQRRHALRWQRYQGGFARGYFLRRYGVLRGPTALRALATEAIAVAGDALIFSHDLAALRGRVAGWRAAGGFPRHRRPPRRRH